MKHSLKHSRYRICFQTRSKVWIYKNSRLRNFYKIRSRIVLKTGWRQKKFLITKNMKWTVARRQMVPYFKNRSRFSFFYKNLFFTKQQLKNFYGGLKEYQFRNIFKKTWNYEQAFRTNIFIGALEQRISMVLFRMRLLPTIFACNQLITHHGVLVNDSKITLISFRVKLGDIVSIPETQWFMFYSHIFDKLCHRFFGSELLCWRKQFLLKKIQYLRLRKKYHYISNLRLMKKFWIQKKRVLFIKKLLYTLYIKLKKKKKVHGPKILGLKILYAFFIKKFYLRVQQMQKYLKLLRRWIRADYIKITNYILFNIYHLKDLFNKFFLVLYQFMFNCVFQDISRFVKEGSLDEGEAKKLIITLEDQFSAAIDRKEQHILFAKELYFLKFKKYAQRRYKRTLIYKTKFPYKRYFLKLLRKLKMRKSKKKVFRNWCKKVHWYVPKYLEVDYNTLRASFIYYPDVSEVHYGFLASFRKIISFYKARAL